MATRTTPLTLSQAVAEAVRVLGTRRQELETISWNQLRSVLDELNLLARISTPRPRWDYEGSLADWRQLPAPDAEQYQCTNCGRRGTVSACETCDKMACEDCLETDYWSSEPHRCATCDPVDD